MRFSQERTSEENWTEAQREKELALCYMPLIPVGVAPTTAPHPHPPAVGSVSIVFPSLLKSASLHSLRDKSKAGQCPCLESRSLASQVPSLCPGAAPGRQPPLLKGLSLSSTDPSPKLPKAESYLLPVFFLSIAFPQFIPPKLA